MGRIWSDIGKAALNNRNLPVVQDLAGLDIDQPTVLDNQIRSLSTGGYSHKARRGFGPRFKCVLFQIFTRRNCVGGQPRMTLVQL